MVLSATSAFAGDSDALKAVLKAKTYAEAADLLKQNLGTMASDAEKAKAYNHLVTLGMKVFNDQQTVMQMNQLMKKADPVDTTAMYDGAYNALQAAMECYKYDQLPDAKGKVKPKFDGNKDVVWNARVQLVNAGQEAAQKNQPDNVLKYWGHSSIQRMHLSSTARPKRRKVRKSTSVRWLCLQPSMLIRPRM